MAVLVCDDPYAIVTRKYAHCLCLNIYWTGIPCKRGHVDFRYTSNGTCVSCQIVTKKEWLASHPGYRKEWRDANPDHWRRWQEENKERVVALNKIWQEKNKEHIAEVARAWEKANPLKVRAKHHRWRARRGGIEGSFTEADIEALFEAQDGLCNGFCFKELSDDFTLDHITPLSRGGTNHISNIQLLCRHCNQSKNNLTMDEWITKMRKRDCQEPSTP